MQSGAKGAFRFLVKHGLGHYTELPVPWKTTTASRHSSTLVNPDFLRKIYRLSSRPREQSGKVLTSAWKRRWLDKARSEALPSVLRISQRSIPVSDDSWWKKTDGSAELPSNKLGLVNFLESEFLCSQHYKSLG